MKRNGTKPRRLSKRQMMSRIVPGLPDDEFAGVVELMKRLQREHPELSLEDRFFISLRKVKEVLGRPLRIQLMW